MGCGACATRVPVRRDDLRLSRGARPRRADSRRCSRPTRRPADAMRACCSMREDGRAAIASLARRGRGLPARVIPFEVHHVASVGLDVWLAALAHGRVADRGARDRRRSAAVSRGAGTADELSPTRSSRRSATRAEHLRVVEAPTGGARRRALVVAAGAGGARAGDVRVHDRQAHDARRSRSSTSRGTRRCRSGRSRLPPGAPFGAIVVDRDACTMCLACVGACPEGAILDNQRGAAAVASSRRSACSADCARRPAPRTPSRSRRGSSLTPEAKAAARAQRSRRSFNCIALRQAARHARRWSTGMLAKLAGHSMFAAPGRARSPADVRRLPRDRSHEERARSGHP